MCAGERLALLLASNASSSSSFAAQTVSVDLSDYDFVFIYYQLATDDAATFGAIGKVGTKITTSTIYNTRVIREATITSTGVAFDSGLAGTLTGNVGTSNEKAIPIYIYGIKGVVSA